MIESAGQTFDAPNETPETVVSAENQPEEQKAVASEEKVDVPAEGAAENAVPEEAAPEAGPGETASGPETPNEIVQEIAEPAKDEQKAEEQKPEPKWYIVQTLTGQEDRVKERIEGSIEELGLKEKIFRVLVPEEETVEIKGDKRIERKRKMYPGYVFIEMALDEDTWYKIRSTAGVARFIGGKIKPQAVTDREMQRVLKQLGIKEKEIKVEFEVGEAIRIISGSFRGYTGSVAEVIPAKSKLKAMINIFGRDTSVEVDFDRVEKIV